MNGHGSLNRIYRLIYSRVLNAWVVVSEITKGQGKGGRSRCRLLALALIPMVMTSLAEAAPTGGVVVSGVGHISQSPVSNGAVNTTITQGSALLNLNWSGFNVGSNEGVTFNQPSASSVVVNRIYDINGAQIYGHLNANGQVYLIDPNGILFGRGAQVNVGGLVASTLDLVGSSGNTQSFGGNSTASVTNQGSIKAGNGGYVSLLGHQVINEGTVTAQLGTVSLGGGNAFTLTFSGNQLVSVVVTQSQLNDLVQNGGVIQANGGQVILTAGAKDALLASAVNNSGIIEAQTVQGQAGHIQLLSGMTAGTTTNNGTLDASAPNGGNGGTVETSGNRVNVANGAVVTTKAPFGLTGTWTLDPASFYIGMNTGMANNIRGNVTNYEDISGNSLATTLNSTNVVIDSTQGVKGQLGNIYVNDAVTVRYAYRLNYNLTLNAVNSIQVNNNISTNGNIVLRADDMDLAGTTTNSTGGGVPSGNGTVTIANGISLTPGLQSAISIYTNPTNYVTALVNPGTGKAYTNANYLGSITAYDLLSSNADLYYIDQNQNTTIRANNYALNSSLTLPMVTAGALSGADLNQVQTATAANGNIYSSGASGNSNWIRFGGSATPFSGSFDGLGHTISQLTINSSGAYANVGFFGYLQSVSDSGSSVQNFGLIGVNVSATGSTGNNGANGGTSGIGNNGGNGGNIQVAGLVANNASYNGGYITNSYVTGNITGKGGNGGIGGSGSGNGEQGGTGGNGGDAIVGALVGTSSTALNVTNSSTSSTVHNNSSGGVFGQGGNGGNGGIDGNNLYMSFQGHSGDGGNGGDAIVGGLVGNVFSPTITNSYAALAVGGNGGNGGDGGNGGNAHGWTAIWVGSSGNGGNGGNGGYANIGGLIGSNYFGLLTNTYATGTVKGQGGNGGLGGDGGNGGIDGVLAGSGGNGGNGGYVNVGGLVGYDNVSFSITNSYAIGSVTGVGGQSGNGGLGGYGGTTPSLPGAVIPNTMGGDGGNGGSGSNVSCVCVGGLVGSGSSSTITNSYATGSVVGVGVTGGNGGNSGSGADGTPAFGPNAGVTGGSGGYAGSGGGGSETFVGGLVGFGGAITNSYATGNVTGQGGNGGSGGLGAVGGSGSPGSSVPDNGTNSGGSGGFGGSGGSGGSGGNAYVGGLAGTGMSSANSHATGNVNGQGGNGGNGGSGGLGGSGAVGGPGRTAPPNLKAGGYGKSGLNGGPGFPGANGGYGGNGGNGGNGGSGGLGGIATVGGLMGWNAGGITDSYATGSVTGNGGKGGGEGKGRSGNNVFGTGGSQGVGGAGGPPLIVCSKSKCNYGRQGKDGKDGRQGKDGKPGKAGKSGTVGVGGDTNVGGLVGNDDGSSSGTNSITNSYAIGSVTGTGGGGSTGGNTMTGGLVGINSNISSTSIMNSYATGIVSGLGGNGSGGGGGNVIAGGLVGNDLGNTRVPGPGATILPINDNIKDSYAMGGVSGQGGGGSNGGNGGDVSLGGLVGSNLHDSISSSYATGSVSGQGGGGGSGSFGTAGKLGISGGNGGNGGSGGNVTVGGLVGTNLYDNISSSYATGSVSGQGGGGSGGGGGGSGGGGGGYTLSNSRLSISNGNGGNGGSGGDVTVGGLVGTNLYDNISSSYATGKVSGQGGGGGGGGTAVGFISGYSGLSGGNGGNGGGGGNLSIGGLVGNNQNDSIELSYATGIVSGLAGSGSSGGGGGNGDAGNGILGVGGWGGGSGGSGGNGGVGGSLYAGGLVGINSNSSASVSVTTNIITNSYATGNITGQGGQGSNSGSGGQGGSNLDPYPYRSNGAAGSNGTGGNGGDANVGGLVGKNSNESIINAYSTGSVSGHAGTGSTGGGSYLGGLIGFNSGTVLYPVIHSFWDTQTSGQAASLLTSVAGTGMTTIQMQTQADFTSPTSANGNINPGWDFAVTPIWAIRSGNNNNYPILCVFGGCSTTTATMVYVDPLTGSSVYGTTPIFTYTLVNSSGALFSLTNAYTTGTAAYTASAPTSTSNAGSYSFSYLSGLGLTGPGATNYSLAPWATLTSWAVGKAPLALSGTGVYNGTTTLAGSALTATGVMGQTFTMTGTGATDLTSANVQTNQPLANVINLALGASGNGGISSNYQALSTMGSSVSVTPAPLTVTANSTSRTYGTSNPTFIDTISGYVNAENATSAGVTGAAALSTTTATVTTAVGAAPIVAGAGTLVAPNYSFTNLVNGVLTINPAVVSVTSGTRAYDGLTDANAGIFGSSIAGISGQTLTLTGSGTVASKNVGLQDLSSLGTLTLGNGGNGGVASNYTLVGGTDTVNITPAPLVVTGLSGTNRTYNGNTVDALTGTAALSGLIGTETLTLGNTTSGTLASANAGSEGVTAAVIIGNGTGLASNYSLTQPALANVTIAQAPLTVIGLLGTNRTYNGSTADSLSGTAVLLGLVPGESLTIGAPTTGTLGSANAGSEPISIAAVTIGNGTGVGAGLASNYSLIQPTLPNVMITPALLTVTGLSGTNRTYNGNTVDALTGTAALSGLIGTETLTLGNTTSGTLASANAGSEGVTAAVIIGSGTGLASNYSLTQPTLSKVTIAQAPLLYTAASETLPTGQAQIPISGIVSGFVAGDNLSNATTGNLVWVTNATSSSLAGHYFIDGSGLTALNYAFSQASGNSTALTVQAANPSTTLQIVDATLLSTLNTLLLNSSNLGEASGTAGNAPGGNNYIAFDFVNSSGAWTAPNLTLTAMGGGVKLPPGY